MSIGRRALISIGALLAGAGCYILWQSVWEGRFSLEPTALAAMFGLKSIPPSMSASSCRQSWPVCSTDYVVTTCVGSILPTDFPLLIDQTQSAEQRLSRTDQRQVGFRFGPSLEASVAYRITTTPGSPGYVSLPKVSGYGDLYVYGSSDKRRFALRTRILTAVDCF